jgi:hypothetical protein
MERREHRWWSKEKRLFVKLKLNNFDKTGCVSIISVAEKAS